MKKLRYFFTIILFLPFILIDILLLTIVWFGDLANIFHRWLCNHVRKLFSIIAGINSTIKKPNE